MVQSQCPNCGASIKGLRATANYCTRCGSELPSVRIAQKLEDAKNWEGAAKVYEQIGMYEKAGMMRAHVQREMQTKNINVSIDLNRLLEQLKEGGIVAVYRCPHCGGKLKVSKETSIGDLGSCQHCGTEIKTMDLAEFLKTVLS